MVNHVFNVLFLFPTGADLLLFCSGGIKPGKKQWESSDLRKKLELNYISLFSGSQIFYLHIPSLAKQRSSGFIFLCVRDSIEFYPTLINVGVLFCIKLWLHLPQDVSLGKMCFLRHLPTTSLNRTEGCLISHNYICKIVRFRFFFVYSLVQSFTVLCCSQAFSLSPGRECVLLREKWDGKIWLGGFGSSWAAGLPGPGDRCSLTIAEPMGTKSQKGHQL